MRRCASEAVRRPVYTPLGIKKSKTCKIVSLYNQNGTLRRGHAQKGLPRSHTNGLGHEHCGLAGAPPAVQDRHARDKVRLGQSRKPAQASACFFNSATSITSNGLMICMCHSSAKNLCILGIADFLLFRLFASIITKFWSASHSCPFCRFVSCACRDTKGSSGRL